MEDLIDPAQGHFSDRRLCVMFRPGTYENVNFPVGYWTQVLGLGETPDHVRFTGHLGVYCLPANTDNHEVGSLDTFWRSAENFTSDSCFIKNEHGQYCVPVIDRSIADDVPETIRKSLAPQEPGNYPKLYPIGDLSGYPPDQVPKFSSQKGMLWAVSQAAPIRRIQVTNNLQLSLGDNYSSGGFMANVHVGGYLMFGTQQQFCIRNCDITEKANGGAWSMVFNGSTSQASNGHTNSDTIDWVGTSPMVVCEPRTSWKIEKPFLFQNHEGEMYLGVPKSERDSVGTNHGGLRDDEIYKIDNLKVVRVFTPHHSFVEVQHAAKNGTHIVLSSGTYRWNETLQITQSNQVVLGIGMATIQAPGTGEPCIRVHSTAYGVRISGLSLEASVISKFIFEGSTLLQWGEKEAVRSKKIQNKARENPGAIHDLYCFVGGRSLDRTVKVQCMVKIYSSHVIGDNLWLWRADHVQLMPKEVPNKPELSDYHVTTYGECICDTGLEVLGDDVVFHGLAIEHTYKDMLIWHGKRGRVYFYQSEMPYDVSGKNYQNVAGYRVHVQADDHIGKGVGVYSYFRDYGDVVVNSALVHHAQDGSYENAFTVWLNGYSGIKSVVNGQGGVTKRPGNPAISSSYEGEGVFNWHFWSGVAKKLIPWY